MTWPVAQAVSQKSPPKEEPNKKPLCETPVTGSREQDPTQLRGRVSSQPTAITPLGPSASSCLVSLLPNSPFPQPVPAARLLCPRFQSNHATPCSRTPRGSLYREIRSKPLRGISRVSSPIALLCEPYTLARLVRPIVLPPRLSPCQSYPLKCLPPNSVLCVLQGCTQMLSGPNSLS